MRYDRIIIDAVASFNDMVLLTVGNFYDTFHDIDKFFAFVRRNFVFGFVGSFDVDDEWLHVTVCLRF